MKSSITTISTDPPSVAVAPRDVFPLVMRTRPMRLSWNPNPTNERPFAGGTKVRPSEFPAPSKYSMDVLYGRSTSVNTAPKAVVLPFPIGIEIDYDEFYSLETVSHSILLGCCSQHIDADR